MTKKELDELGKTCHGCLKMIQAAAKDYDTQWNILLTMCVYLTKECVVNGYAPQQPGSSVFGNLYVQRMALHYIAKEYPGRTIENIIQNIESRIKEQDKL